MSIFSWLLVTCQRIWNLLLSLESQGWEPMDPLPSSFLHRSCVGSSSSIDSVSREDLTLVRMTRGCDTSTTRTFLECCVLLLAPRTLLQRRICILTEPQATPVQGRVLEPWVPACRLCHWLSFSEANLAITHFFIS